MLCNSSTEEVGYEGDTCKFACDIGYKLKHNSSVERTCQSNGNWNGSEAKCTSTADQIDSSSDRSSIPGPLVIGIIAGIITFLIITTFFIVIIYFKCLQRRYPYAGVSDSSLRESKLHILEVVIIWYVIMLLCDLRMLLSTRDA